MIRDSKILVQYKCDLKYIQIVLIFHVFTTVERVLNFTEISAMSISFLKCMNFFLIIVFKG